MSEQKKIAQRAGVVGFFTLVSRFAGLIRDVAIAHAFGTKLAADAFFVAFRIPNLLRRLFAEGALTVSFVPVFTQSLRKSHQEAKDVVDVSFSALIVMLTGVAILGVFFSPWLVHLTAWGFTRDPEKYTLTVYLTRVMFPYILMVSLAAWAMGILNSVKHFSSPAASPIFMNLGIILGAFVFTQWFHPPVLGLAIGVLVGGMMQLGCHFPFLLRFNFWPKFKWDPSHPAVKKILGMMIPAAYGAAVYQFNVIAITFLASFLPEGSVSYLWYADRVMEFPLGVFAISLATVILPTLADHAADKNLKALKETFGFGLRMIFFITLPAAAGLIVLSKQIIRVLFQHGSFSDLSTIATSHALIFFAVGLPFIAGVRITSNAFYSLQDSKTPVRVANRSVLVNFILSLILMWPLKHNGLALAVSLSSTFNFMMHLIDFRKKVGPMGLRKIIRGLSKSVIASVIMMAVLLILQKYSYLLHDGFIGQLARLVVDMAIGAVLYFLAGFMMRMEEMHRFMEMMRRKKKTVLPPPPPSDSLVDV